MAAFCHWQNAGLPEYRENISVIVHNVLNALAVVEAPADMIARATAAAHSYAYWNQHEFGREHDPSQVHGETNHFRYRTRPWHIVRWIHTAEFDLEMAALICIACLTLETRLEFSLPHANQTLNRFADEVVSELPICFTESDAEFVQRIAGMKGGTLRVLGTYEPEDYSPQKIGNIPIVDSVVMLNGRIELLKYLKEQSVTEIVHRYGNIV